MINENYLLKEKLKEIKGNDFKAPKDINIFDFALEMMSNIGDIDPKMRDELIYETFCRWIDNDVFTKDQMIKLLNICMDDYHLFYKIGERGTDSVFTRSFSALIIAVLIYAHRKNSFLSCNELGSVNEKVIRYMIDEKDVRGYVEEKGWAHSAAHTADVLDELAQCSSIEYKDLIDILEAIKIKVCNNSYAYVSLEDERMSVPVISIYRRNILEDTEIINWIKDFGNINKINHYPEDHNLTINIKNFLRSIYFRMLNENSGEEINNAIREALSSIIRF